MSQRLRLYDLRTSRLPSVVGLCQDNIAGIANFGNSAIRRLLYCKEAGPEGWHGTFAEMVFAVSRDNPYITMPREVARVEYFDVCDRPIVVQNQFSEYLRFGNGRMPRLDSRCNEWGIQQAYSRNDVPTFIEMTPAPQYIVAFCTDAQDIGKRALIQGLDTNNEMIYTQDNGNNVTGMFVELSTTGAATPLTYNQITGIQKDVTVGPVRFYQRDPNTGDDVLLLTMQPSEQTASYRRYYLNQLPCNCCATPNVPHTVQVRAMVKLDLIPMICDTDYCLIPNLEAVIEECQAIRYSEMDTTTAKQMEAGAHQSAVRRLNGELDHFYGKNQFAVGVHPFGSARLNRQKIGSNW